MCEGSIIFRESELSVAWNFVLFTFYRYYMQILTRNVFLFSIFELLVIRCHFNILNILHCLTPQCCFQGYGGLTSTYKESGDMCTNWTGNVRRVDSKRKIRTDFPQSDIQVDVLSSLCGYDFGLEQHF